MGKREISSSIWKKPISDMQFPCVCAFEAAVGVWEEISDAFQNSQSSLQILFSLRRVNFPLEYNFSSYYSLLSLTCCMSEYKL